MASYDDLDTKRIFIVGIFSVVVTAVTALAVQVVYYALEQSQQESKSLQSNYGRQNRILAAQSAEISQYGVDETTGNFTIPVDKAMALMLANTTADAPAENHSQDSHADAEHKADDDAKHAASDKKEAAHSEEEREKDEAKEEHAEPKEAPVEKPAEKEAEAKQADDTEAKPEESSDEASAESEVKPDESNDKTTTKTKRERSGPVRSVIACTLALTAIAISAGSQCAVAQDSVREGDTVNLNGSPPEQSGVTVDQNLGKSVPLNLPLTDSLGRRIKTGYFIDGEKPTIITLNYSDCPMLCNVQLNQLTKSLDLMDLKVGKDFNILTVSIDPRESTERVRETKMKYMHVLKNQPDAEEGWEFCTAKQPVITKLADILGFRYKYDVAQKQYNHPAMLAFLSPEGVISRYSLKIDFPPEQMKMALVDAGEGTVGSKVDQFILWCYSYDPASNSYTPAAWKIMRAGGFATVCIILACLIPYWIGRKGTPDKTTEPKLDVESATI